MKAVAFTEYGGPERIGLLELPMSTLEAGQLRVRVAAATVNPADIQFLRGDHDAFVAEARRPFHGGLELVGTVVELGPGVSPEDGPAVGALVAGTAHFIPSGRGCHAEYVAVPAAAVVACPTGTSPVELTTVPMNGLTARVALDSLPPELDGPVVVSGAAGAVGSYVTELAAARGLQVLAIGAASDERWLRELGATWVVRRGDDVATRIRKILPDGASAAVDAAKLGEALLSAVADDGTFLALRPGHVPGAERGIVPRLVSFRRYRERSDVLSELVEAATTGALTTRVAAVHSPHEAVAAFAEAARPGLRGRVVLDWTRLER